MTQVNTKRALGRGLSALLEDISDDSTLFEAADPGSEATGSEEPSVSMGQVTILPIEHLIGNKDQPRAYFDPEQLEELANSIREQGIVQPILVRPLPNEAGKYEIVAGERRWRAAQRAKLHEVPVIVRELSDAAALEIAIIENVQRSDLNAMEEAYGYAQLAERYGYTQEMLARKVGKSRPHIANTLRLLNLPRSVQDMVRQGELAAGAARATLGAPDPEGLAATAAKKKWNVRRIEREAQGKTGDRRGRSGDAIGGAGYAKDADTVLLEGDLSAALLMAVEIAPKTAESGTLSITYDTLDELAKISALLRGEELEVLATG